MKTLNYNQRVAIASIMFLAFVIALLVYAQYKGTLSNLNSIGY